MYRGNKIEVYHNTRSRPETLDGYLCHDKTYCNIPARKRTETCFYVVFLTKLFQNTIKYYSLVEMFYIFPRVQVITPR